MSDSIKVQDLYVEDIVKSMAKNLVAPCHEEYNITKLTIPDNLGKGFIKATQFASGLGIIEAVYNLKEDLEVEMEKHKVNPLKFIFNLGDAFFHKFEKEGDYEGINKYSGAIMGSSIDHVHTFKIPKNKDIHTFSIELNRNLFEHKINTFKFQLDDDLNVLLRDVKSINPFLFTYPFNAEVYEVIQKIINSRKDGFIGSLYKEGLSFTILSDTLETYLGQNSDFHILNLSVEETDFVLKVSNYIEQNLSELPTIDIIASKNFVSESKIQKLFKIYYSCSVNDFIKNKRLTQARSKLEDTNLSIAEVADDVGISSKSYFSKIFKERYGVSPSDYRGSRLSKVRLF